jgi:hypothetical protein
VVVAMTSFRSFLYKTKVKAFVDNYMLEWVPFNNYSCNIYHACT